jgi:hypothetical protein
MKEKTIFDNLTKQQEDRLEQIAKLCGLVTSKMPREMVGACLFNAIVILTDEASTKDDETDPAMAVLRTFNAVIEMTIKDLKKADVIIVAGESETAH